MMDNHDKITTPTSTTPHQIGNLELKHQAQELGLVGKLFGSSQNAPLNIAGTIIILSIFAMIIGPSLNHSTSFTDADIEKTFGALVLAGLSFMGGFLGGKSSKN